MTRKNRLHPMLTTFGLSAILLLLLPRRRARNAPPLPDGGAGRPHPSRTERRLVPYHFRNNEDYDDAFSGRERKEKALGQALETRKFEIELYWKRATYFWTFIAAALAAYGIIRASKDIDTYEKTLLSVVVGVLGFVFSFAWHMVNRGSKKWQENWENHVALLEDDKIGPLFKVVSRRKRPENVKQWTSHVLTGASAFSVSKINQLVSIFVILVWMLLVFVALPPFYKRVCDDWHLCVNWYLTVTVPSIVILGVLACVAMFIWGKSDDYSHTFHMTQHTSHIIEDDKAGREN